MCEWMKAWLNACMHACLFRPVCEAAMSSRHGMCHCMTDETCGSWLNLKT